MNVYTVSLVSSLIAIWVDCITDHYYCYLHMYHECKLNKCMPHLLIYMITFNPCIVRLPVVPESPKPT